MFEIIMLTFFTLFLFTIGLLIFPIAKAWRRYWYNLIQPQETVSARVTAKRNRMRPSRSIHRHGASTRPRLHCYVTFEFQNGHRRKFRVDGSKYGRLTVGDQGELSYQGSWFLRFAPHGKGVSQVVENTPKKGELGGLIKISVFMVIFIIFAVFLFAKFVEFGKFGGY